MAFTLYIQTNSPGELASWVKPVAKQFVADHPDGQIVIFLTPCQYASGREMDIAKKIPGVIRVYSPRETLRFLFLGPFFSKPPILGAMLYLGGDPMYARILGWKLKLPIFGYTERDDRSWWGYTRLFSKIRDGDLMSASIAQGVEASSYPDYCVFFGGSRPQHFAFGFPFLADIIRKIKLVEPEFKAVLGVSSFISDSFLNDLIVQFELSDITITREAGPQLISQARLLVTLPGTNTAEAMYLHTPMGVLIPLNHPELFILDGLLGLLTSIPVLGIWLKLRLFNYLKNQNRFYALPNIVSGYTIVPEWIGVLDTQTMANTVLALYLDDKRLSKMKSCLSQRFVPSLLVLEAIANRVWRSANPNHLGL